MLQKEFSRKYIKADLSNLFDNKHTQVKAFISIRDINYFWGRAACLQVTTSALYEVPAGPVAHQALWRLTMFD